MVDKNRLQEFKLFSGFQPDELDSFLAIAEEITFNKGDVILEESSLSTDLFVLLNGRVDVEIVATQSLRYRQERKRLAILRVGDVFGEMAFLEKSRRSARVTAFDEISVLKIDRERIYGLFDQNARIGYMVMRNLASILAQRLADLNFMWRDDI